MSAAEEKQGSLKLILFNKNQTIKYFGGCKLNVDIGQENLITFTLNNGQVIFYTYDRKILKRMNLMGMIDDRTKKHMIIVFSSKETCAKTCNFIQNNKPAVRITDSVMEESEFKEKLFRPLLKLTYMEQNQNMELKAVIQTFLNCFDENQLEQKKIYKCLIADASLYNPLSSDATVQNDNKADCNPEQRDDHNYITLNDENDGEERASMDESMEINCTGDISNRSGNEADWISFDNDGFNDEPMGDISSYNLRNRNSTISQSHVVNPIIQKPNFEVANIKTRMGNNTQRLTILDDATKKPVSTYVYQPSKKKFICYGCVSKKNHNVYAKLVKNEDGEDCAQLFHEHVCDGISEDASKALSKSLKKATVIVHKPNFQITTIKSKTKNRPDQQCLTILDDATKNPISKYIFQRTSKRFLCYGCVSKKNHTVYAKVIQNDDGEECAHLFKEHVCQMND